MSHNTELPEYVRSELLARGLRIVAVRINGSAHPSVEIEAPNGSRFKWSWPRPGKHDPHAMKNNKSQLKRQLDRMEELWRTRKN